MTEVDITGPIIVECPKCQKGVWLLSYGGYDENAIHYCRHFDYTFATDLRGKLLALVEWAKRSLEKIHAQEVP